jgi:hypothetical protein
MLAKSHRRHGQQRPERGYERRVTVSDAMKEMRVQIAATQSTGYMLDEIIRKTNRNWINICMVSVKYALYRPAVADSNSDVANRVARADDK